MEKKQTIGLEGMEFYSYHGYYDEEQKIGAYYLVDVYLTYMDRINNDNLEDVINYEVIYTIVKAAMHEKTKLIEFVAENLIANIKQAISREIVVKIIIKKKHPPLGGTVANAIFILER